MTNYTINEKVLATFTPEEQAIIKEYAGLHNTNFKDSRKFARMESHLDIIGRYEYAAKMAGYAAKVDEKISDYQELIDNIPALIAALESQTGKALNRRVTNAVSKAVENTPFRFYIDERFSGKEYKIFTHGARFDFAYWRGFTFDELTDENERFNPASLIEYLNNSAEQFSKSIKEIQEQRDGMTDIIKKYNALIAEVEAITKGLNHNLSSIYNNEFNNAIYLIRK